MLGGIFNKLPLDGYYSLENCKEAVTMYFQQYKRREMPYGFVAAIDAKPTDEGIKNITAAVTVPDMDTTDSKSMDTGTVESAVDAQNEFTEFENQLSEAFMAHVDLDRLMHDIWIHEVRHTIFFNWKYHLLIFTYTCIFYCQKVMQKCRRIVTVAPRSEH